MASNGAGKKGRREGKRISICHSTHFFAIKKNLKKNGNYFFNSENLADLAKFLEIFF